MSSPRKHRTLPRRTLGAVGPEVTRVGLGLAALGRPGYINLGHSEDLEGQRSIEALEARCHAVLDAAYGHGIRYFDAARSYGRAEAFLSSWLRKRELGAGDVVVASKWGYTYTAGWKVEAETHEVKEHSIGKLEAQLAESRALLGEHLAVYQVHSATFESGVLADQAVLDRLARLRDEGMLIGLSLSGARQADVLRSSMEVARGGRRLFDVVQATWNLFEPSVGDALREAHLEGFGIVIKEALANGRLTARNDEEALQPLREEAARLDCTVDALALAAALAQPFADVVLSGVATEAHLESNLAALAISSKQLDRSRLALVAEPAEVYWKRRSALPWN